MRRICVYCGSNPGKRPEYAAAARDLADVLVRHDLELVYGGADKGIMGIIADEVLARGGAVHGVIPKMLCEKEIAHQGLSERVSVTGVSIQQFASAVRFQPAHVLPGQHGHQHAGKPDCAAMAFAHLTGLDAAKATHGGQLEILHAQ